MLPCTLQLHKEMPKKRCGLAEQNGVVPAHLQSLLRVPASEECVGAVSVQFSVMGGFGEN